MEFILGIVLGIIAGIVGSTIANKKLCNKIIEFVDLFKNYVEQIKSQNDLKADEIAIVSAKVYTEHVRTDRQDAIAKIFNKYNKE